ncbi:hypothetical protein R1sor_013770 [Riccia sorocarpa]|uniref:Uncharacterized protein n=1 Tax=Riccia sorocarpa TaxID=122646 RepID=A0ABD3HBM9_9MARC
MLDEEIVAIPFHALVGAFDVDMIEESEETGTAENERSIETLPPSPCKPNKLAPELNATLEPKGKSEEPNPKPMPNPADETHSRPENLTLNNLLEVVQTGNASNLHELEKILVIPGEEWNKKLHKNQDDDYEQIASPEGEEVSERRQFPTGIASAEVEDESEGDTELEDDVAKVAHLKTGTGETLPKGDDNLALMNAGLGADLEEETLAEVAAASSERNDKCSEQEDMEAAPTGGEQGKGGSTVIFAASKTGGRCVTVWDSQRRPGSWCRRSGRHNSDPRNTPNIEEGFSGSEESREDEPNLAEGSKQEDLLTMTLDMFYLSGRGEWVYHIRMVDHQGARTLSDHVPISMELVLKADRAA